MKKKKKYIALTICGVLIILAIFIGINPPISGCWNPMSKNMETPLFESLIVFDNEEVVCYSSYPGQPVNKVPGGTYKKTGYCKYNAIDPNQHVVKFSVGWFYMEAEYYIEG